MYHDEATEQLRFWNGADRVTFSSGGNVGIGTSAPSQKLEVVGMISSTGASAGFKFPDGTIQTTAAVG